MFPLSVHLFFHFALSFLVGLLVYRLWGKLWLSIICAIIGGFLVDFDHFIDYFLAFGFDFKLDYFTHGYQFLKSDKIYVLFHGWEYAIILVILALVFKNKITKTIFLGLALGLFFHLTLDVFIDGTPPMTYSVTKRIFNNFDTQKLVYPEHWKTHMKYKDAAREKRIID